MVSQIFILILRALDPENLKRERAIASRTINIQWGFSQRQFRLYVDRSKYLKEVILKIMLLYKSLLCIFNFVGPGYLMSEMIRT